MQELTPCFQAESDSAAKCEHVDEVNDAVAFQAMLAEFFNSTEDGKPRASTVLVALHNIVTSTVNDRFVPGRQHYYCVPDALRALRSSKMLQDTSSILDDTWTPSNLAFGLGAHRLINCTPGL